VTVTDTGSRWNHSGTLVVGNGGNGALNAIGKPAYYNLKLNTLDGKQYTVVKPLQNKSDTDEIAAEIMAIL